jgi:hypothetical protein
MIRLADATSTAPGLQVGTRLQTASGLAPLMLARATNNVHYRKSWLVSGIAAQLIFSILLKPLQLTYVQNLGCSVRRWLAGPQGNRSRAALERRGQMIDVSTHNCR